MTSPEVKALLEHLLRHEEKAARSINLTASENVLSPLARVPFVLDAYTRYFLDDRRLFGSWFFYGGKELGSLQQVALEPVLRHLARAPYVNVRPISGISGMIVAMSGLTGPADVVLSLPVEAGGHASTSVVATGLGVRAGQIPMASPHDVDLDALEKRLKTEQVHGLYIDQSNVLFPIDPQPLRDRIERCSPSTWLHYDSSHANGLILGGAYPNPLDRGASSFGGSTHKTLPGPHKAFLATREGRVADAFTAASDHFVSHHHLAEVISLAITLLELRDCGGDVYARRVIENAQAFAAAVAGRGVFVAGEERGFTGSHQVWVRPDPEADTDEMANRMVSCGLIVNRFGQMPGIPSPAFRISLSEVTKLGATREHAEALASAFCDIIAGGSRVPAAAAGIAELVDELSVPRYCYGWEDLARSDVSDMMEKLRRILISRLGIAGCSPGAVS